MKELYSSTFSVCMNNSICGMLEPISVIIWNNLDRPEHKKTDVENINIKLE